MLETELSNPPNLNNSNDSGMDRVLPPRKLPSTRIIAITVLGSLMILATLWSMFDWGGLTVSMERLVIARVVRGPFQEFTYINGIAMPLQTFYLDAIEGGRVEAIFAQPGAMVRKGDPLLQLTNTGLQLDVMYREALTYEQINNAQNRRLLIEQNTINVKSQLADVETQARQARLAFVRDSALYAKDLISLEEYTRSRNDHQRWDKRLELALENFKQDSLLRLSQLKQIEASLGRLQMNLEMVRRSIDNLTVRAPIAGHLTSLNAEIGQLKSPGERLGQIDVVNGYKVRADVDEYFIDRINVGQLGIGMIAGAQHPLKVTKVYPEVREGRFEIDFEFQSLQPASIRRGQTLQIRLELSDPVEATLLPKGVFFQKTAGQWVYVVDPSRKEATKRMIKVGRQNPDFIEVIEGLEPGTLVIVSGYEAFRDADKLFLK